MFPAAALTSMLMLALSVAANPVTVRETLVSLPFAKHINSTGSADIVKQDQARIKQLLANAEARKTGATLSADASVSSISVTNDAVSYVASVGVGEYSGLKIIRRGAIDHEIYCRHYC